MVSQPHENFRSVTLYCILTTLNLHVAKYKLILSNIMLAFKPCFLFQMTVFFLTCNSTLR